MNKELLEQALEAALSLLEYEHEEYTETRRKWGEGNPHRWERLKECTEKTNALVNSLRDAIEQDCAQRQAGQKRAAGAVMMSAHALCPTDMSHPRRMEWMAGYFLENSAEIAALKAGLAVIRGHLPIPAPGSELGHAWAEAMGVPERIPAYVTACIDAKDVEIAALRKAVEIVCEDWQISQGARKMLESALWPAIAQAVQATKGN